MNLHQCFLTKNDCYKKAEIMTPTGIIVHSTGCNNPYLKRYVQPNDGLLGENIYGSDWNRATPGGRRVCVHAFIGKLKDGTIATYQTLPWNYIGWHCGEANYKGYIGFEICEDGLNNKQYFNDIYKEAVELCAYLCKLYNLNPIETGTIIDHSEAYKMGIGTGHMDVSHWWPKYNKDMDAFRVDVMIELQKTKEIQMNSEGESEMTQEQFNRMMDVYLADLAKTSPSTWANSYLEWGKEVGIISGDDTGNLMPRSFTTREQMVTMLKAFYEKLVVDKN